MSKKYLSYSSLLYLLLGMAIHTEAATMDRPSLDNQLYGSEYSQENDHLLSPEDMLQGLKLFLSQPDVYYFKQKTKQGFVRRHAYAREIVLRCHQVCLHPNATYWHKEQALHCLAMLSTYGTEINPAELNTDRAQLRKIVANIEEIIQTPQPFQDERLKPYLYYFFRRTYVDAISSIVDEDQVQEIRYLTACCRELETILAEQDAGDETIKERITTLQYFTREELLQELGELRSGEESVGADFDEDQANELFIWLGNSVIAFVDRFINASSNDTPLKLEELSDLLLHTGQYVLSNIDDKDVITMYKALYEQHNKIVENVEERDTVLGLKLHLAVVSRLHTALPENIQQKERICYDKSKRAIKIGVRAIVQEAIALESTDDKVAMLLLLTPKAVHVPEAMLTEYYNTKHIWALLSRWSMELGESSFQTSEHEEAVAWFDKAVTYQEAFEKAPYRRRHRKNDNQYYRELLGEYDTLNALLQAQTDWFASHYHTLANAYWQLACTLPALSTESGSYESSTKCLDHLQKAKQWHDRVVGYEPIQDPDSGQEEYKDAHLAIARVRRVDFLSRCYPTDDYPTDKSVKEITSILRHAQTVLGGQPIVCQEGSSTVTVQQLINTYIKHWEASVASMSDAALRSYLQLLLDTAAWADEHIDALPSQQPMFDTRDARMAISRSATPTPRDSHSPVDDYVPTSATNSHLTPRATTPATYTSDDERHATPTPSPMSYHPQTEELEALRDRVNQTIGECLKVVYERARAIEGNQEDEARLTLASLTRDAYLPRHGGHGQQTFFGGPESKLDLATTSAGSSLIPSFTKEYEAASDQDMNTYFDRFITLATPPGISVEKQKQLIALMKEIYDVEDREEGGDEAYQSDSDNMYKRDIASIPQTEDPIIITRPTIDTLLGVAKLTPRSEQDKEVQGAILDVAGELQQAMPQTDQNNPDIQAINLKITSSFPSHGVLGFLGGAILTFVVHKLIAPPKPAVVLSDQEEEIEESTPQKMDAA